ncbi:hypothetical protein DTO271G3_2955 [Paecilomyces variotii]|nr:hypothetical protein DTO271G3_2955 [Paecilomyces variotii]
MEGTMDPSAVRELHDDLARKYRRHAAAIESAWRSLDQKGRATCLKAGAKDGVVLKHRLDRSLGDAIIIPEWNLRDITEPGSDFLLGLLKHRATTSLFEQYCSDANARLTLPDLTASARDQQESLEEYLELLSTEPTVLTHAVNMWFFSRRELVANEKGRRLPVDKYISPAFFDAVHSAVKGAAVWGYICRLLELFRTTTTDKVYRAILLQEISNILYLEYERSRALFKRYVQVGTGSKWFKRVSNAYDRAGNARVVLKCKPEQLSRSDPQLHYMLRLCQSETNSANAVDWIKKLSGLHEAHQTERERLTEIEAESLCDLAVIVGFIQDLSSVLPVPSVSRKTGQLFISKYQESDAELNQLGKDINLHDYVAPINNLLEPGMAESALNTLDHLRRRNRYKDGIPIPRFDRGFYFRSDNPVSTSKGEAGANSS